METFLIKAVQLMLALAILVTFHEFGHFIVARIFGIKVEKFYLFFNPWFHIASTKDKWFKKLFPKFNRTEEEQKDGKLLWRDTEYGIGWVPLGGYVKIAGMIDESMDKEQMARPAQSWEFRAKPAWQRLCVMLAGVVFNFLLAMIIYAGIVHHWGESVIRYQDATAGMEFSDTAKKAGFQDGDILLSADSKPLDTFSAESSMQILQAKTVTVMRSGKQVTITLPSDFIYKVNAEVEKDKTPFMTFAMPVVVKSVEGGMAAAQAGMKEGDKVMSINGEDASTYTRLTAVLQKYAGKEVTIGYIRAGQMLSSRGTVSDGAKLGISLESVMDVYPVQMVQYNIFESIPRGIEMGVDKLTSYVSSLSLLFSKEGAKQVGGFGAIGGIFPDEWDWYGFWNITAFLSVMLAFMNVLPIPALDGGHALFCLYEIITRRTPSEKFLERAQTVGMMLLFALLIYANGNDIYRFLLK